MENLQIIILRTIFSYIILLFLMKFMGKREIGQMGLFDLLIMLSIIDIMVMGIENFKANYLYSLIPLVLISLIQKMVAFFSLKSVKFRNFVDGKSSLIIDDGKVDVKAMKKCGYNMDDLYTQLRLKNVASPNEVSFAILEANGRLSVFLKKDYSSFVLPLIVSGKIIDENLKKTKYKIEDIKSFLKKEHLKIEDVYGLNVVDEKLDLVRVKKE